MGGERGDAKMHRMKLMLPSEGQQGFREVRKVKGTGKVSRVRFLSELNYRRFYGNYYNYSTISFYVQSINAGRSTPRTSTVSYQVGTNTY